MELVKESILKKICLLFCIITFLGSVSLVINEADATCDSFLCMKEEAKVRQAKAFDSLGTVTSYIRTQTGSVLREIIKGSQSKHIQTKSISLLKLIATLFYLLGCILALILFSSPEAINRERLFSLCIVEYIHKKDGSK